jgi:hypothetical protein
VVAGGATGTDGPTPERGAGRAGGVTAQAVPRASSQHATGALSTAASSCTARRSGDGALTDESRTLLLDAFSQPSGSWDWKGEVSGEDEEQGGKEAV